MRDGRLDVKRCVALDIVAHAIAIFFGREPGSHPFPRVNTQPIALNARLEAKQAPESNFLIFSIARMSPRYRFGIICFGPLFLEAILPLGSYG
jgi:hypothetical protein